jgi:hypothetical protein
MTYGLCHCSECQKLDRLPVHRHGIPHARQPSLLDARVDDFAPVAVLDLPAPRPPAPWESLPLFGGLQPDLF